MNNHFQKQNLNPISHPKKGIRIFLLITFILSWLLAYSLYRIGGLSNPNYVVYLSTIMLIPAFSVLLTRIIVKEDKFSLPLKPRFGGHIRYYLLAWFVIPLAIALGGTLYYLIFPGDLSIEMPLVSGSGSLSQDQRLINAIINLLLGIIIAPVLNIIFTFGEELGWRGYLVPQLLRYRTMSQTVLISGLIWGIWHAPIIAMGYNYGANYMFSPWPGIIAMCIFCIVVGSVFSFLSLRAGSVWPAVVAHGALNGFASAPLIFCANANPNPFIGPLPLGIIGGLFLLIWGIYCYYKLCYPPSAKTVDPIKQLHRRKLIAPIIITVILVLWGLGFGIAFATLGFFLNPIIAIIIAVIYLVVIVYAIYNLLERIKEIRSGEEDDLSKY